MSTGNVLHISEAKSHTIIMVYEAPHSDRKHPKTTFYKCPTSGYFWPLQSTPVHSKNKEFSFGIKYLQEYKGFAGLAENGLKILVTV